MGKNNKTDNFLKAIKKYSELERQQIEKDIATAKESAFAKAEKKGKRDADSFVAKEKAVSLAAVTREYAEKQAQAQSKVYKTRENITNDVFSKAKAKLVEYTATNEYKNLLIALAKEIAEIFGDNDAIVSVKNDDMKYADEIKALYKGQIQVVTDSEIEIGGIKGNCEKINIVADNTLDSKLMNQMEWFSENSQLKVV